MASFAARSFMRSATNSARAATAKTSAGRASPSPFRILSRKPQSSGVFRSPVELSSISVVSILPHHSATASAVLTSMLSVASRSHAWIREGL